MTDAVTVKGSGAFLVNGTEWASEGNYSVWNPFIT